VNNVTVKQNSGKTNAKTRAATLAAALVSLLVVLGTNYGIEFDSDLVQGLTLIFSALLIPIITKFASYLKPLDDDDLIATDEGGNVVRVIVDKVGDELEEIDHKTGKRKRLKKILRIAGKAIKFLT